MKKLIKEVVRNQLANVGLHVSRRSRSMPVSSPVPEKYRHFVKDGIWDLPYSVHETIDNFPTGFIHQEHQRLISSALFFLHCNNFYGNYFEFGVYQALTFRQTMLTAKAMGLKDILYYAFDSFEGFPQLTKEDYSGAYGFHEEAGTRAMSEEDFLALVDHSAPDMMHQVKTVKGFYDKSLDSVCAAQIRKECAKYNARKDTRAAFVNIDCDLYESAQPVFTFIEDFIDQGSIIYIDDYWIGYHGSENEGVAKAFKEYREVSRFDFSDWGRIGGWGHAFVVQKKR